MKSSSNERSKDTQSSQNKILTIPNILSFFRLCLIPVIMWLYCVEENYLWAGITLILSGITDTVDGFVARHFHMTSEVGRWLHRGAAMQPQEGMLFCLLTRSPRLILPLALMVVKETFMGITGLLVIHKTGKVFGADWHGKVTTWLLYAMMILHVFWYNIPMGVSRVLIGVCVAMMLVSLVLYGRSNLRVLREGKQSQTKKYCQFRIAVVS